MAATYTQVRDALADACRVLTDFSVHPTTPQSVTVPAAIVQPGDPVVAYRGRKPAPWTFEVLLVIGVQSDQAQQRVAELINPGSPLIAAIDAAFPDGGATQATVGEVPIGSARYVSALITVSALR